MKMSELIFKPRKLNFPYHYNLCYYKRYFVGENNRVE